MCSILTYKFSPSTQTITGIYFLWKSPWFKIPHRDDCWPRLVDRRQNLNKPRDENHSSPGTAAAAALHGERRRCATNLQWSAQFPLCVGAGACTDTAFSESSIRQDYLSTERSRFPTINCGQKRPQYWTLKTKPSVDSIILVQNLDKNQINK